MLKINAIFIGLNFFIRNGNRSPVHWFAIVISTRISFVSTKICFKIYSIKHWKLFKHWNAYIIMECLQLRTSPKKWDTKLCVLSINHDVLSVYCCFFITLMFVYLQKLLHCLIIFHTRQIHRFYRVHETCDQSDLAIKKINEIWWICQWDFGILLFLHISKTNNKKCSLKRQPLFTYNRCWFRFCHLKR